MQTFYDLFKDFNWAAIIFGLFIEIIGGFLFIFVLLYLLKPKIKIVPSIVVQDNPFDETTDVCHGFKIINRSFFSAYDLEVIVELYTIKQSNNGIIDKTFQRVKLKTDKIHHIPRRRLIDQKYGDHCVQFFTYEDLTDEIIKGSGRKYIQFQISAKHGLSGLSNIFTHVFEDESVIIRGKFKSGNCSDVKIVN